MARQSSQSSKPAKPAAADEPDELDAVEEVEDVADLDDVSAETDDDADADFDEEDGGSERSAQADAMWSDVRIEPVEVALPKGVGYTLRAYRLSNELTPTELDEEEDDFAILHRRPEVDEDDERVVILENAELFEEADEQDAAAARPSKKKTVAKSTDASDDDDDDDDDDDLEVAAADKPVKAKKSDKSDDDDEDDLTDEADEDDESDEADETDEVDEDGEEDDEDEEAEAEPEEVPAFLSHQGKLLLFRSVEGLVEFVKSDAEHDLVQLDTWESLKTKLTAAAVAPTDENRYELDLVVENLRGGRDAWDTDLLLAAGELSRDLAYALRLEPVRTALSAGSPLDDLDEALRAAASGGVGGFFAKRRLRKVAEQQAALGWRTIIGKISAAVDWRD